MCARRALLACWMLAYGSSCESRKWQCSHSHELLFASDLPPLHALRASFRCILPPTPRHSHVRCFLFNNSVYRSLVRIGRLNCSVNENIIQSAAVYFSLLSASRFSFAFHSNFCSVWCCCCCYYCWFDSAVCLHGSRVRVRCCKSFGIARHPSVFSISVCLSSNMA